MELEDIKKQLDENTTRIVNNIEKIGHNAKKIEQNSYALEILRLQKKENQRLFWLLIVTLIMWFLTIGYLVYTLNDTGTIADNDTIEIQDVETIDNSHIKIGDDLWEKSK